jgi:hypothetical protein
VGFHFDVMRVDYVFESGLRPSRKQFHAKDESSKDAKSGPDSSLRLCTLAFFE